MNNSKSASSPTGGNQPSAIGRLRALAAAMTLAYATAAILALGASPAQAKLYKWVDEKGVVHYTDTMPPDEVNKGNVELSKQGVQIRKTDPAASPESRRAREEEAERLKQAAKEQQETLRRDRAVLDSYTSEDDIDLARKRSLKTVEQALQSAMGYTDQLTKRKDAILTARANSKDKTSPAVSERELARIESDLGRQAELVARKRAEMTSLITKYDNDKERWRAAKARIDAQQRPLPADNTAAGAAQAGKATK